MKNCKQLTISLEAETEGGETVVLKQRYSKTELKTLSYSSLSSVLQLHICNLLDAARIELELRGLHSAPTRAIMSTSPGIPPEES